MSCATFSTSYYVIYHMCYLNLYAAIKHHFNDLNLNKGTVVNTLGGYVSSTPSLHFSSHPCWSETQIHKGGQGTLLVHGACGLRTG